VGWTVTTASQPLRGIQAANPDCSFGAAHAGCSPGGPCPLILGEAGFQGEQWRPGPTSTLEQVPRRLASRPSTDFEGQDPCAVSEFEELAATVESLLSRFQLLKAEITLDATLESLIGSLPLPYTARTDAADQSVAPRPVPPGRVASHDATDQRHCHE